MAKQAKISINASSADAKKIETDINYLLEELGAKGIQKVVNKYRKDLMTQRLVKNIAK